MGRRRYESEFMNRELTKSFPERNDSKAINLTFDLTMSVKRKAFNRTDCRSSEAHHFLEIAERAVLAGSKRFHLRAMAAEAAN